MLRTEIDVVIPVANKDICKLDLCLTGLKINIQHNIKNIYIISKPFPELLDICLKHKCIFIDETSYLGFSKSDLNTIREDKHGWLLQQLIKLNGNPGNCENYLVLDSDVVLLKPYVYLTSLNQFVFVIQKTNTHLSYKEMNFKLTGFNKKVDYNFVDDKMLFNVNIINNIHKRIQEHTGLNWIEAIISKWDNSVEYCFSEFELYWLFCQDLDVVLIEKVNQIIKFNSKFTYNSLKTLYPTSDCITMHHWMENT